MKIAILITVAVALLLWSCDPMRRINMKNNTYQNAEITWFIKQDSISSSPFFISSSKDVKFKLAPVPDSKKIKMSFGIGTWSHNEVTKLADDLDSVIITWDQKVARLISVDEIRSYLMARRRGLDKSKIHILLNEDH